jgi:hypothetical protein
MEYIGLFLFIAGFVVGLGAVTVIDLHGFLGRHSSYWTQATIRTHKVTKPLIWLGIVLAVVGGVMWYSTFSFEGYALWHGSIALVLIGNGCFLSFVVSPYLLRQEKEGNDQQLLPAALQKKITISFFVSFIGWWVALVLLVLQLV